MSKADLSETYLDEYEKYQELFLLGSSRTSGGSGSWVSTTSGVTYNYTGGQDDLFNQLYTVLADYLITASDYNTVYNHIGTGGAAHANAVASGAAGFMTGADKAILDGLLFPSGAWADSSTSISASSTYTKNIALGFSATKGRLFAKGSSGYGAMLAFDTLVANAHGLMSYYMGAGGSAGINHAHSVGSGSVSLNLDPSDTQFGSKISLNSARINGSDLELIFKNWDGSNPKTLTVDLYWEVE